MPEQISRSQQIRQLLLEGPATASELTLATSLTKRSINVGLWVLQNQHHVVTHRYVEFPEGKRRLKLYELTPHGRAVVKVRAAMRAPNA